MSPNFKFRKLLYFLLCLTFIACSKKEDTTPEPENCVLKEISVNAAAGNSLIKFLYDSEGKLVRRDVLEAGALVRYSTYQYNNKQLINKESFYKADGTPDGFYTYSYDDADLLIQMESNMVVNGTLQQTFYCTYDYASESQIARRTMWHPDGRMMSFAHYEYENGEMRRVQTHNSSGQHTQTLTLQYDDQKTIYSNMKTFQKIHWLMVGFPSQHNITSYTNTTVNGQLLNDSYNATIEFNKAGFPVKVTRISANGSESVNTYTYMCK